MQKSTLPPSDPTPRNEPARPRSRLRAAAIPLVIFAALAALFAFALRTGDPSKLPSAMIGKPVPVTTFPAISGLMDGGKPVPGFSSSDLGQGNVTVVNFWASWCVPCIQEHPQLIEVGRRTGVDIVGINYKDDPANARRFLGRYGNPFKAVGADSTGRMAIEWGVYGMPETFVVDGRGEIAFKHVGPITPASLEDKMLPAIAAAQRAAAGK